MPSVLSSRARLLVLGAVVLVPLAHDPAGFDTLGVKALVLSLGGALLVALAGLAALGGHLAPARPTAAELLLLALTAWSAFSIGWAVNPDLATVRTALLFGTWGVAAAARDVVAGPAAVRRWIVAVIAVGCVAMAWDAAVIVASQADLPAASRKYASVLFVHHNMAASYVAALVPLATALLLGGARVRWRLVWCVPLLVTAGYLLLLRSRAGLLAGVLGLGVVALLFALRPRLARAATWRAGWAVALGTVVVLAAALPFSAGARGLAKDAFYRGVELVGLDVWDAQFRPRVWSKTIEIAATDPLRGVGAGNFPVSYARHERLRTAKPHAHNDALQVLAELGVPGLLLFLGAIAALAGALVHRLAASTDRGPFALAAGLLGSLVVFVAGGLVEVPFALGVTAAHLALLVGLTGALGCTGPPGPLPRGARWALGLLMLGVAVPALVVGARRAPAAALGARAAELRAEGRLREAYETQMRIAALRTGSDVPLREAARLLLELGDAEGALARLREARQLWPYGTEYREHEGDALVALERYDEAAAAYREAREGQPSRTELLYKEAGALERAGRRGEAIELLSYALQADPQGVPVEVIWQLALYWRNAADELEGSGRGTSSECLEALVASRHYHALYLQDGDPARMREVNRSFKHLTHRLQLLPGSPDSWWKTVYRDFLERGQRRMPGTALYTSLDEDGVSLYPGWHEPAGPPVPRSRRY